MKKEKVRKAEARDICNRDMKHSYYCLALEPYCSEPEKHSMPSDVELRVSQAGVAVDG